MAKNKASLAKVAMLGMAWVKIRNVTKKVVIQKLWLQAKSDVEIDILFSGFAVSDPETKLENLPASGLFTLTVSVRKALEDLMLQQQVHLGATEVRAKRQHRVTVNNLALRGQNGEQMSFVHSA